MPGKRPSAAFDPIPPDFDLARLVEETPNFEYVTRISCDMIDEQGMESFDKLVLLHVILGGKPLVIEGFNYRLDEWTFTCQWLQDNCGKKFEQARVLNKRQNMPVSIGHYLNNMAKLTDQWTPKTFRDPDRQRIYLKDIDCPQIWHDKLKEQIPQSVFYLNDSTGDIGGPGSVEGFPGAVNTKGQGIARAGDLMSCLPPQMRAENMMCYIGHEGTYTPAHREMCASLGQNLMVETSGVRDETGKPTKPGSSIWFMTETNDRHMVSEYWLSALGHDIEVEDHFAQINAWKAAPFKTYIVDQRAGDFILIPPLAPHQVWNRGTRTMKAAWNRTTVETLEMALHEALPRARMVCRDEQYKNKAIVYYALQKYSGLLKDVETQKGIASPEVRIELEYGLKIRQLQKDFKRLFSLYTEILLSEMLGAVSNAEKRGQYLAYDSFVTCSYCRCNIFNRFLTCTSCIETLENGDEDTYDICMDCFAMGRSCRCISRYKWVEQFHWKELVQKHETWRQQIVKIDGGVTEKSPQSLEVERKRLSHKTLAEICQEQLKARPFQDPKKPQPKLTFQDRRNAARGSTKDDEEREIDVDSDGNVRRSKSKSKSKKTTRADRLPKGWTMEHVSSYPEQQWKVASCSKCDRSYSYGSLYRMFDLMPQSVMQNSKWECPACLKICSCGSCRKRSDFKPYEPVGTVLGHDTKKVADPRSTDSLVNFSLPNTNWLKVAGDDHPHDNRRLSRRRDEAEKAKAKDPALDDNYVDEEEYGPVEYTHNGIKFTMEPDIPIDPMLSMEQSFTPVNGMTVGRDSESEYTGSPQRAQESSLDLDPSGMGGALPPPSDGVRDHFEHRSLQGSHKAPVASMLPREDQTYLSNGTNYQYPDPTLSQPSPVGHYHPSAQPVQRRTEANMVHDDPTGPSRASDGQSHLTQLEQVLAKAKENDRYTSTEASFTGRTLRVKLSISSAKLARIHMNSSRSHKASDAMQGTKKEPPVLLQSDFPSTPQSQQANVSKKRKVREKDNEFITHKRQARKSSVSNGALPARDTRRKSVRYTEVSSDSETPAEVETSGFTTVDKPQIPRPLPKYLAQRHGDDGPSSLEERTPREATTLASETQDQQAVAPQAPDSAELGPVAARTDGTVPPGNADGSELTARPNMRPNTSTSASEEDSLFLGPARKVAKEPQGKVGSLATKQKAPPMDPALKLAEDNRKAKLRALHWDDDDDDSSGADSPDDNHVAVSPKKRKLMATPKSIFSRPGMNGKKVKIVGVKSASSNGKSASKAMEIARRALNE